MGKKLNLSHLTTEECDQIMDVLQKDFQVRRAEKRRVSEAREELVREQNRVTLLKEKPKFNDTNCILCLERFGIIFHRKRVCYRCQLNVCNKCCQPRSNKKDGLICLVCIKEKSYKILSNQWFYESSQTHDKHIGSSKIVRSLFKRNSSSLSDMEADSGYPHSSTNSAPAIKTRPRLDQVFDINVRHHSDQSDEDETFGLTPFPELVGPPPRPQEKPVSRAVSLESLTQPAGQGHLLQRSSTPAGTQTTDLPGNTETETQTFLSGSSATETQTFLPGSSATETQTFSPEPHLHTDTQTSTDTPDFHVVKKSRTKDTVSARPRSCDFDAQRNKRRKDKETRVIYREAFDGAKRAEEFKFKVKFDQLLVDLHQAIEEKTPDGLTTSFASPSYGEVMLTFREKVKDILHGYTQRLALAYESFVSEEAADDTVQKVKQDASKFIEDLIGESLDLTSDEAFSDLSSLSDESTQDQNSFEDLLAQAVVSKLLENHRKEVSKVLNSSKQDQLQHHKTTEHNFKQRLKTESDVTHEPTDRQTHSTHLQTVTDSKEYFNKKPELIPDHSSDEDIKDTKSVKTYSENNNGIIHNGLSEDFVDNDYPVSSENDVEKDFEELKEFVKKTQSAARPKLEAREFDDSQLCEVQEEPLSRSVIDRDEERENFHTRTSLFDRIHNSGVSLPDFSQFDNIDFASNELDPDLLSMNLAIIPEETEEELEDEERKLRANWIFMDKSGLPSQKVVPKKLSSDTDGPRYMMVPPSLAGYTPKIGNRDIDQLSDFTDHDLLSPTDGSDDEDENTFYANTSKELARISAQRNPPAHKTSAQRNPPAHKYRGSSYHSDDTDYDARSARRKPLGLYDRNSLDYNEDYGEDMNHISGPIVEPTKQEIKLLENMDAAKNDDPKFLVPPESVVVQEGEPVKFSCRVGGTSPIDVFWYREGDEMEELEDSEDVEMSTTGDRYSITLYNTSKSMAGQYMCMAINEVDKAIQYLVVTVKDNKQELKRPEFIKGLKDVEVTEGQSVKFRVKVKGYPPPRISWYKDTVLLKNSKSCRIEKFGNRDYILTIDYASMDDDAEYTVSARNVAGEVKMSAQVIVEPQSDQPIRRQRHSSVTTSGASDSDSDRTSLYKPNGTHSPSARLSPLTTRPVAQRDNHLRDNHLRDNHIRNLDRKVAATQQKVEHEKLKMVEDDQRNEAPENRRLMSSAALEILQTAEEIIQQEHSASAVDKPSGAVMASDADMSLGADLTSGIDTMSGADTTPGTDITSGADLTSVADKTSAQDKLSTVTTSGTKHTSPLTFASNPELELADLSLPDQLDEFNFSGQETYKPAPVKSTFELTLPNRGSNSKPDLKKTGPSQTAKTEPVSLSKLSNSHESKNIAVNRNIAPLDINQNDKYKNNSLTEGTSLQTTSPILADNEPYHGYEERDLSLDQLRPARPTPGQYSRDFEVPVPVERKKWSVTLDPFSPSADVINKSNIEIGNKQGFLGQTPAIEVSDVDLSPTNSLRSSKDDQSMSPTNSLRSSKGSHSSQSSPRQSIDSGVSVSSKLERPAPVHMVGHTSEDEVPESRTEFNTDGSIELPSVNKLRAMFSNIKDDDLGDGSFKRKDAAGNVHSITARSVPKEKLEKLRAANQKVSNSEVAPNFLDVPDSAQSSSSTSSTMLQLTQPASTVSTTSVSLKPLASAHHPLEVSSNNYLELNPDKDPVLIYPDTDPNYMQRHHLQVKPDTSLQQAASTKPTPAQVSPVATPIPPPRHHKGTPHKPEESDSKKSGPRIKSGCISARAAFWERKMIDGASVDDDEFPEMVED